MAAMSRDEILNRYIHLREINRDHASGCMKYVGNGILEQARHIGLAQGRTIVAEYEDELTLAVDLAIYTAPPGRSRAIDRYARAAAPPPGSDEALVLEAMRNARFSIWRVESRHETAGLVVRDLVLEDEVWLVDVNMERSAVIGAVVAMRLFTPEDFAMSSGVLVPLGKMDVEEVIAGLRQHLLADPGKLVADRRFATEVYRVAVRNGLMERVRLEDPD